MPLAHAPAGIDSDLVIHLLLFLFRLLPLAGISVVRMSHGAVDGNLAQALALGAETGNVRHRAALCVQLSVLGPTVVGWLSPADSSTRVTRSPGQ